MARFETGRRRGFTLMERSAVSGRKGAAFTLVELLVVIAIIGILVALLLPAIQAARESARRSQCLNNLHQWNVAMHLYHDVNKRLPPGGVSKPKRLTWVPHLWPHVEEGPMAEENNLEKNFYEAPMTIANTDQGLAMRFVAIYYCPDDGEGVDLTGDQYRRRRGNYVVNFGNQRTTATEVLYGVAPFSNIGGAARKTELSDVSDGTANTLLMSEAIRAKTPLDKDHRGDFMNDNGHFRFNTSLTPNTSAPDIVRDGFYMETGDPLMPATSNSLPVQAAARSRHPGGVNANMCDGSGTFYSNEIDAIVWKAMGTMNGEELISDSN
jgi:prepilin-type N-terminal cleavage/methylation domain-containing protein/prepilin-type processing-associated H-X9-DG protein